MRGALAKRTRYYRVAVLPWALEPGSRHHIWRDALQLAAAMMTCVRIMQRCTRGRLASKRALWKAYIPYITPYGPWQIGSVRNAGSFFVYFVGTRFLAGNDTIFQWARSGRGRRLCPVSTRWLLWNLVTHPLLGEENSTLPPRWLWTASRIAVREDPRNSRRSRMCLKN